ncbi:MAG: translation initiation factor IF-2 [Candidatus Magasanikbacteria bacterium CG10_big_fil_rev_8_21_14_0_10_36_32]|uniref:Translation initiation factor IF-2 n=1 Tax=Candidatus Magasanikbacteria bacterium CG10_big_fil_rev_8_21_14_0_10_36_32 TaxID=1974646 RepID=A0A2M6W7H1_9BACT|nr:MAG: translation initiation factor IF-2 [Candidatus Magasanikbacteria bacterium CG10_big_fil_rev_8_21_14_0_10_36_32]
MNVTDLARHLKVHPQKLLQILPEFGFDIGAKAVKVDDRVAERIQKEWRRIKFVLQEREKKEAEKQRELEKEQRRLTGATVDIPDKVTVKELSALLGLPLNQLILELMKNGILATQNEHLDYETAAILVSELGFNVSERKKTETLDTEHEKTLEKILTGEKGEGERRPPVIVIMGHVDHGKTKLLDAIRTTNVVDQEAGGITQHIGAYQVIWNDPKTKDKTPITFIDTPGHEAFTVMRGRGAKVADIAILVVAADDGVKPQTVEAINIAKAAKLPLLVVINKIDKQGADPQKTRTELVQHGLVSDEWGGEIPMVEISAKNKVNIDKLLDTLLLIADINSEHITAVINRPAAGTVIEAHVDKGEGPVATVLIQTGTLKLNDPLVVNGEIYGKVRAMKDYRGVNILEAGPSCPVRILGFKVAPQVGDVLDVGAVGQSKMIDIKAKHTQQTGAEKVLISTTNTVEEEEQKKFFNVIVKADMLGSLEAIIGSLEKIKNDEVAVKVVGKGLGNITADDVSLAETTGAVIFGFNTGVQTIAEQMIRDKGIKFLQYKIIYDLLDFVKKELEKLLNPERIVTELGNFKVVAIFRTDKASMILGGRVENGKIQKGANARVKRHGEIIGLGKISQVQMGKQNISEVPEGSECGLQYEGKLKVEVGDILEAYREEEKNKKFVLN